MFGLRPRASFAILAAAAVAIGASTALAGETLGLSAPTVGTPSEPVAGPPAVRALDRRQQQLDALKQPESAATAVPGRMRQELSETRMAGENPDLGRKARTTSSGDTYWVVPAANGKVCLFVNGGGGGCGLATQIAEGTFTMSAPCHAGGVAHSGLLPSDATDASLTLDDGSKRSIAIVNNVWAITIPSDQPQPTSLGWTHDGVEQQAPVHALPTGSFAPDCAE